MTFVFENCFSGGKISLLQLPQKREWIYEPSVAVILIVIRGELSPGMAAKKEKQIEWGHLFLMPPGNTYAFFSGVETECLLFEIREPLHWVEHVFPPLSNRRKQMGKPPLLSLTPLLWEYTHNVKALLKEHLFSSSLSRIKILELFCLLKISYSKELLALLFSCLRSEEKGFTHFVEANYRKAKTVEELARLSGHSLSGFEKRFKQTFHIPPYKWMMERKKELICYELIHCSGSIQDLADKCGFSSPSQMSDFCKKQIGLTPGAIRRKRKL